MNVRLDEFLVLSRASYIFNMFSHNKVNYLNSNGEIQTVQDLDLVIPNSAHGVGNAVSSKSLFEMTKNFEFILGSLIEGLSINKYVLCRKDKTMEYIIVANFPHERKDNGEIIDVQIPFMFTQTDVVIVSPFNAPDMVERFKSPNEYIIGVMSTNVLIEMAGCAKAELLQYLTKFDGERDDKNASVIENVIDAVATSIQMRSEYFLKELQSVPETGYRVITEDSKEFERVYAKYGKMIDPVTDDMVRPTDFTPILIKDGEVNKSLIAETSVTNTQVVQKIIGIESFDEVLDLTGVVNKEVLIRCPEMNVPLAIKLPSTYYYVGYNTIVKETDVKLTTFQLLSLDSAMVNADYIPIDIEDADSVGVESDKIDNIVNTANEKFLIPFKKFGIVKGTALYESFYPVLKMPVNVIKSTFSVAFGVIKANSKLEKEKSEEIKEQLLNDELDSTFVMIELFFAKFALLMGTAFILGNFWIALIVWVLLKNRNKKIYIKSIERVERQVVSKIREYEKKVEFATQESDYESVKKLTHIRDTYKAMLDKLREVKKDTLKKEEKFTDTYAEYNHD